MKSMQMLCKCYAKRDEKHVITERDLPVSLLSRPEAPGRTCADKTLWLILETSELPELHGLASSN